MKISKELTENIKVNALIAEDQDEYYNVHANKSYGITSFAFDLDDEDIEMLKEGRKIYISLLTGKGGMQPINVQLCEEHFKEAYEYNVEFMTERGYKE